VKLDEKPIDPLSSSDPAQGCRDLDARVAGSSVSFKETGVKFLKGWQHQLGGTIYRLESEKNVHRN